MQIGERVEATKRIGYTIEVGTIGVIRDKGSNSYLIEFPIGSKLGYVAHISEIRPCRIQGEFGF